ASGYGGDKGRVRFGYLRNAQADRARQYTQAEEFLWPRRKAMGKRSKDNGDGTRAAFPSENPIWPNTLSTKRGYDLSWAAMTNRYFACAVLPTVDATEAAPRKTLDLAARIDAIVLNRWADANTAQVAMRLTSPDVALEPGATRTIEASIYAGPLARADIASDPDLAAVSLQDLVVYNFGGPCAPCTFTWLTYPLLGLLRMLHGLLGDWALSIILMVVCVRTILHPVTRWSQIKMQRFGKQMQELGPKQKKLQERYKDDKKKMQEEMQKLWREEGLNPAGALGCLPMFLQTPVWIALYATLYFAIELRQQPAFYGVFQSFGHWTFLRDLAEPDAFIAFGSALFNFPLWGEVRSFNVLPIILGFVFFAHQKFLSPPTSATMTPEQEQQQKIMKVMMVVMFPVFMYNAPSGMAIYFIANSTIAIFENKWIRAHAEKKGLLEVGDQKKRRRKPGRFMAKLQKMAAEQQRKQQLKNLGPRSQPKEPKERGKQRTYKKR
ncbi:MAG: YidC/Oxa1 family insertase periplasmic-domain containing protein, partial [Phycisphaerales bacterium]|nr:YidC/Oxa1 family insertase periplasmic-domain containing protein [Phycisphaerales bacterium]